MLLRKKDQGIKKRAAQGCPQRHAANHIGARRRHLQRRNICHPNFVRGIHIARKVIAGRALHFLRNFSQGTIGWISHQRFLGAPHGFWDIAATINNKYLMVGTLTPVIRDSSAIRTLPLCSSITLRFPTSGISLSCNTPAKQQSVTLDLYATPSLRWRSSPWPVGCTRVIQASACTKAS